MEREIASDRRAAKIDDSRDAVLEQMFAVRDDIARRRTAALRQAGANWLDLAMGYVHDFRRDAGCETRTSVAHRTFAELDDALRKCIAEEARLREILEHFDLRIAIIAQGAVAPAQVWGEPAPGLRQTYGRLLRAGVGRALARLALLRASRRSGGQLAGAGG